MVFHSYFRFSPEDVNRLRILLGIPDILRTPRNKYVFTGNHALLIVLRRLAYTARFVDLQPLLGRHKSELSEVFKYVVIYLTRRWDSTLCWDDQRLDLETLQFMSRSMRRMRCPLGNVFGFLDGTFRPNARPSRFRRATVDIIIYMG